MRLARHLPVLLLVVTATVACSSADDRAAPASSDTPASTTTVSTTTGPDPDTAADETTATSATCDPGTDPRPDLSDQPYADPGDAADGERTLDLHRPDDAGCAVPLVVWVHGGGWQIGDKRNRIDDKVALWNEAGWAVASVDYRLTDAADPPDVRLMAPAHNEDVAAAMAWLIDGAADLGLDPGRVALLGHSAGAAIVAALAADPSYLAAEGLEPDDLACVAPLDTEGFDVAGVIGEGGVSAGLYTTVFGDDPDRWTDLSPITHLGEADVPDLFLVTRGLPDRRAKVADFADAAEQAGAGVTVVDLTGFSHEDANVRIGAPGDDRLTPALQDFLSDCLDG